MIIKRAFQISMKNAIDLLIFQNHIKTVFNEQESVSDFFNDYCATKLVAIGHVEEETIHGADDVIDDVTVQGADDVIDDVTGDVENDESQVDVKKELPIQYKIAVRVSFLVLTTVLHVKNNDQQISFTVCDQTQIKILLQSFQQHLFFELILQIATKFVNFIKNGPFPFTLK